MLLQYKDFYDSKPISLRSEKIDENIFQCDVLLLSSFQILFQFSEQCWLRAVQKDTGWPVEGLANIRVAEKSNASAAISCLLFSGRILWSQFWKIFIMLNFQNQV